MIRTVHDCDICLKAISETPLSVHVGHPTIEKLFHLCSGCWKRCEAALAQEGLLPKRGVLKRFRTSDYLP